MSRRKRGWVLKADGVDALIGPYVHRSKDEAEAFVNGRVIIYYGPLPLHGPFTPTLVEYRRNRGEIIGRWEEVKP